MTAAILALLTLWTNWNAINTNKSVATVQGNPGNYVLAIKTPTPLTHLSGLVMRTASPAERSQNPTNAVTGYHLDRGIYSGWRFNGSTGADTLEFGSQGVIISKRLGGVVDFRNDTAPDVFRFTNKIDVKRCSEKHGFQCHPLNHLQQVTINNFGREDVIDLQGKIYRYNDVKNGVLPEVPSSRLKVNVIK